MLALKADRIARWFVGCILILSTLVFAAWYLVDPHRALWATLAVLVATCPCALSLATPVALTISTHRLARAGFLITRGHVFETLAEATHIVFDKTGTLTEGRLELNGMQVLSGNADQDACLKIAAALEAASEHPVASAFRHLELADLPEVAQLQNHPGQGLSARIDGIAYRIGHAAFALDNSSAGSAPTDGRLRIWLSRHGEPLAWFDFEDKVRATAAEVIGRLKVAGLQTVLLSGDHSSVPRVLGQTLGIDRIENGLSPQDKIRHVEALQAAGGVVIMVGDGINDAPVLGKAHVSVAMGSGADLAQISADAVLLGDRLEALPVAIGLSGRTRTIIRQNLYWSLVYNLAVIPPAALGYVSPWLATIGMSASSLLVVLNALRLKRH